MKDRFDNTALTAEAKYAILHNQEKDLYKIYTLMENSFFIFNAKKVYQFNAKHSEIKYYSMCLGNVSKDFTINNTKKTGLKGVVKVFVVDFNPVDANNILGIHKYLMKKGDIK